MKYIENVKNILVNEAAGGNVLEYGLSDIVREVTSHGACTRDFIIMNNAFFRHFDEFLPDWRLEMTKFCEEFGLIFSVTTVPTL